MVLQDRQASSGLQLLVVQRQQVGLCLFDFVKHFFTEFLCGLDLFTLFLIDGVVFDLDLVLQFLLKHSRFSIELFLLTIKFNEGCILSLQIIVFTLKLLIFFACLFL